ncbi:MAG: SDR family oxidoreductase [Chloroflexi bacterium]|nr:SDR family oxidoreductase [Chloroflexota bacterium]
MVALDDKVILITGAGRGVGRATALHLAGQGARVALLARTASDLAAVARTVDDAAGRPAALALPADVADAPTVRAAVEQTVAHFGGLDGLVLSAGIGRYGPTESYALADWQATLGTNLTGAFICAQAALPHLRARGGGSIIGIASGAALRGYATLAAYCASKFGLRGLLQALAAEYGDVGIRCTTLCPGSILTDFGPRSVAEKRQSDAKYLTPDDVAAAIAFLLTQPATAWTDEMTIWPFRGSV